LSERALIVVSRVASGTTDGDGFADLSAENRQRAGKVNDDPAATFPSEEWLEARSVFIEEIAAPAMRQVQVPLTWVWRTCTERRDQVVELRDRIFPDAVVTDDVSLTNDEVAPDAQRFLTVRLDSDDALLPEALERIAAEDLAPSTLVNWWRGWRLNWETGEMGPWFWKLRLQGPFLGLTHESRAEMLQAGVPHTYAREGRRHIVSIKARSWLQTIHGHNQLSRWQVEHPLRKSAARRVRSLFT
jgi:hypothetical protein